MEPRKITTDIILVPWPGPGHLPPKRGGWVVFQPMSTPGQVTGWSAELGTPPPPTEGK